VKCEVSIMAMARPDYDVSGAAVASVAVGKY
jgi:hypothetical protein